MNVSAKRSALLLAVLFAGLASADEPTRTGEADVILSVDIPVTAIALGVWGGTSLAENRVGPKTCSWCDTTSSLNGFDRLGREAFRSANRHAADTASDVIAYGAVPLLAFGMDLGAVFDARRPHKVRRFLVDALLITEATATAMTITQLGKFVTARRRPSDIEEPTSMQQKHVDENLSFPSGHTTFAFALASSAGTLSTLRHERLAPLVWVLGMSAATVTGMLRVAADRHFASDVLLGSAIGSAVGVIAPVLHRRRIPVSIGGSASSTQGMLSVSGRLP